MLQVQILAISMFSMQNQRSKSNQFLVFALLEFFSILFKI